MSTRIDIRPVRESTYNDSHSSSDSEEGPSFWNIGQLNPPKLRSAPKPLRNSLEKRWSINPKERLKPPALANNDPLASIRKLRQIIGEAYARILRF